jgi:hypothetical protein
MKTAIIFNDSGGEITRRTMGAYKIADMVRSEGWNAEVVDWVSKWSNDQLSTYLDKFEKIDLFAFGNLWMDDKFVIDKIKFLRDRYPGTKYLLGGPRPYQQDFDADVMIFGYAEHALYPALDFLFNNGPTPKGIVPHFAPNSLLIDANKDYRALEIPNYKVDYQESDFVLSTDVLTLEMTRGCRFKCKYCSYAFLGIKEDYSRTEDSIYDELMNNYIKWGTTNYLIADDTFNDRDIKVQRLANVVKRLPFEPNFTAFIRLDLVISRPQQLQMLIDARVWGHFYGIETLHPEAAKAIGKGMHPDKIKQGLLDTKAAFMNQLGLYRGTCGMIAGLPYEPVESWYSSLEWMNENWDCFLFWALHISTDPFIDTHSDFSVDANRYGYSETQDDNLMTWANDNGLLNINSAKTHKLDKHVMIWEADWANIKQAYEFSDHYNKNYFASIKLPNFELMNFVGRENLLDITADDAYISQIYKHLDTKMIDTYISRKTDSI